MPDIFDPYAVLGVPRGASPEDIKRAYRRAAREHHPDVNMGDDGAEDRFKDISRAYEMLTDRGESRASGPPPPGVRFGFTIEDILMNSIGTMFYGQRPFLDMRVEVPMTLMDLLNGKTINLRINRRAKCQNCDGSGRTMKDCERCNGTGEIESNICESCFGRKRVFDKHCPRCNGGGIVGEVESMELQIPPGLNVSPLVVPNAGNDGDDGSVGNLVLTPRVHMPEGSQVISHTKLVTNVGIDPAMFIVGGTLAMTTPFGDDVALHVPEGSEFGKEIEIPEVGLPMAFGSTDPRDSLVVRIVPEIPADVSPERAALLREYIRLGTDVGQSLETSK